MKINNVYNLNCLDGMKLLDDEIIDLTVTSPPYDNIRNYKGYSFDFESIAKEFTNVLLEKHEYNKTRPYKHGGKSM